VSTSGLQGFPHPLTLIVFVAAPLLAIGAAFVLDSWIRRTEGRVAFFDDRIVFQIAYHQPSSGGAGPAWTEVRWGDVLSFDDGSSEHVVLKVKRFDVSTQLPLSFSIPTLNEKDRVAALALLDEKGVRRES
jgi:hypothetical protein